MKIKQKEKSLKLYLHQIELVEQGGRGNQELGGTGSRNQQSVQTFPAGQGQGQGQQTKTKNPYTNKHGQ